MHQELDNITLIQRFVQGETRFLKTQDLRLEPSSVAMNLVSSYGMVLAQRRHGEYGLVFLAKKGLDFGQEMEQALQGEGFIPVRRTSQGFMQYEHYPLPPGYDLNFGEVRQLWRGWWMERRSGESQAFYSQDTVFSQDTMLLLERQWQPIRAMACQEGTVIIKTWGSELQVSSSTYVVWLHRSPSAVTPVLSSAPSPEMGRKIGPAAGDRPSPQPVVKAKDKASTRAFWSGTSPTSNPAPSQPLIPQAPDSMGAVATSPGSALTPGGSSGISSVIRFSNGQLFINTAIGEVVISGQDIKFWLNPSVAPEPVPQPLPPQEPNLHVHPTALQGPRPLNPARGVVSLRA